MITDEELAAIRNHMDVVRYDDDLLPNVLVDDMLRLLDEIEQLRTAIQNNWQSNTEMGTVCQFCSGSSATLEIEHDSDCVVEPPTLAQRKSWSDAAFKLMRDVSSSRSFGETS